MSTPTYDLSRNSLANLLPNPVSDPHGIAAHDEAPLVSALLGVDFLQLDERFADARPTLAIIRRSIELQMQQHESLLRQHAEESSMALLDNGNPTSGGIDQWIA